MAEMADIAFDTSSTWAFLYTNAPQKISEVLPRGGDVQAPVQWEALPSRRSYAVIGAVASWESVSPSTYPLKLKKKGGERWGSRNAM